jgi:hypothetical protein
MFNFFKHIDFELEGQVVKHINGADHWEFNGVYVLRWLTFPWNHIVHTTFAVGEGYSYTTSLHKKEYGTNGWGDTVKGLHYIMYEVAVSLPEHKEWSIVGRHHHRSNVFGLMGPPQSIGSNYYGIGIKYRFAGF